MQESRKFLPLGFIASRKEERKKEKGSENSSLSAFQARP
jgi:hypothetical protein